jgi:glycosyltransferase involved in cell wall biosynthesis
MSIQPDMLTVLITTYNRPKDLREALRSVMSSFGANTPVVIGDNGDSGLTRALLREPEFADQPWRHIINPPGSNYLDNLKALIAECKTDWLTLLHDDDFFVGNVRSHVEMHLKDESLDFIFSDHYVANAHGVLLEMESESLSRHYRRAELADGFVSNLPLMVAEQRVGHDGFFVRTSVAWQAGINLGSRLYLDGLWLFRMALLARNALFIKKRLFAYRLSLQGATVDGLDQNEMLHHLILMLGEVGNDREVEAVIKQRIERTSIVAMRWGIKRFRLDAVWLAALTLITGKIRSSV